MNLNEDKKEDEEGGKGKLVSKKESETRVDAIERESNNDFQSVAVMSNHSYASRASRNSKLN